jgi:hypothetical protein
MNEKSEDFISATHFYVFVGLGGVSQRPTYHVVPSADVAKHTRESHNQWLQTPGRGGRKHVDNPVRNFSDRDGAYVERWDLLGL